MCESYAGEHGLRTRADQAGLGVEEARLCVEEVALDADAGVKEVWIHMGRDTPEALDLARENGMNARTGTCAVMYVKPELSYHSIHRWIAKRTGKY